ncbi:MAG: alpha/beta hydrolase-fold protein [Bacteroidia bacterium]
MKKFFTLIGMLLLQQLMPAQISGLKPFTIGESFTMDSEILGEKRTLNVYLPGDYHEDSLHEYPVIYLLDGSADEDFIHIAGLVQFCSFSWINIVPQSIVIGIGNVDRKRDFTYPSGNELDQEDFPTSGGSENFIRFIEKELQPLVRKRYRVSDSRTLIGQSLGGLLATEILLKKPELFEQYIIVSPSLWWDDEALLGLQPQSPIANKSVYVAVGKEGEVMERTAQSLYDKILSEKAANTAVFFTFFEAQNHGDALHLAVYDAFEKIFKMGSHKN